jgi:glycerol-3-phosphate acyltransferase PlsY
VAPVIGFVAAALVGYLLGAINPAVLMARAKGIDLRSIGSGNPGASNAGRALGRRTGVLVALLDVAKGAVPASSFGLADHRWGLVAGLFAVAGHITSPWLRGRGGKGVATAAGAICGSHPLWAVVVLGTWVVVLAASRWIALASMISAAALLVPAVLSGRDRLWAAIIAVVVIARHTGNVVRRLPQARGGA